MAKKIIIAQGFFDHRPSVELEIQGCNKREYADFKELSLNGCTFTCNQYTIAGVYKGVYCQCQLSSTLIAMCQTNCVRIIGCFCVPSGIKWQCCNMSKVKEDTSARCWPCQTLRPRLPSACSGAVELNKSPFWKDVLNDTTQFRVPRDTAEDAVYATLTNLKHVLRQPGCQERSPLFTRLASMLALIRLFRFQKRTRSVRPPRMRARWTCRRGRKGNVTVAVSV